MLLPWGVEAFIWMQVSREADHTYVPMNTSTPHDILKPTLLPFILMQIHSHSDIRFNFLCEHTLNEYSRSYCDQVVVVLVM